VCRLKIKNFSLSKLILPQTVHALWVSVQVSCYNTLLNGFVFFQKGNSSLMSLIWYRVDHWKDEILWLMSIKYASIQLFLWPLQNYLFRKRTCSEAFSMNIIWHIQLSISYLMILLNHILWTSVFVLPISNGTDSVELLNGVLGGKSFHIASVPYRLCMDVRSSRSSQEISKD
jgi:hypothetical protein